MNLSESYFHTGIIVADLDAGIRSMSDALGIRFTEPLVADVWCKERGSDQASEICIKAVYSMTEPPYVELIQAVGDGILGASNAGRILYHGVWEDQISRRIRLLECLEMNVDLELYRPGEQVPFALFTDESAAGTRIEYVDSLAKPRVEEWVRTGRVPRS